ncbi:MaoC family dehydratase [Halomarina litorea]|uniref:MaoC family dehydratase n=1 Tax=Halomarina litorea TaxID=2961595 RepID=UPI0020C2638A|nr:MaoC family dehydratase [Halomarina sp. BCD28]
MTLYFEDIEVGHTRDCGSVTVTREDIVRFAERYDPQPFHLSEEAASETMYGGLIASGWQTAALTARLLVESYMNETASAGGRGIDALRWHAPVRPGDTLSVELEVLEKRPDDRGAFGHTRVGVTTTNGDGETVCTMEGLGMVKCRKSAENEAI